MVGGQLVDIWDLGVFCVCALDPALMSCEVHCKPKDSQG